MNTSAISTRVEKSLSLIGDKDCWKNRVDGLKLLNKLMKEDLSKLGTDITTSILNQIKNPLTAQLEDLRSQVFKEAAGCVVVLCQCTLFDRSAWDNVSDWFITPLFNSSCATIAVIASASQLALKEISSCGRMNRQAFVSILQRCIHKHTIVRTNALQCLLNALQSCSVNFLHRQLNLSSNSKGLSYANINSLASSSLSSLFFKVLKVSVCDSHADARRVARLCYWALHAIHEDSAVLLYEGFEPSVKRTVDVDKKLYDAWVNSCGINRDVSQDDNGSSHISHTPEQTRERLQTCGDVLHSSNDLGRGVKSQAGEASGGKPPRRNLVQIAMGNGVVDAMRAYSSNVSTPKSTPSGGAFRRVNDSSVSNSVISTNCSSEMRITNLHKISLVKSKVKNTRSRRSVVDATTTSSNKKASAKYVDPLAGANIATQDKSSSAHSLNTNTSTTQQRINNTTTKTPTKRDVRSNSSNSPQHLSLIPPRPTFLTKGLLNMKSADFSAAGNIAAHDKSSAHSVNTNTSTTQQRINNTTTKNSVHISSNPAQRVSLTHPRVSLLTKGLLNMKSADFSAAANIAVKDKSSAHSVDTNTSTTQQGINTTPTKTPTKRDVRSISNPAQRSPLFTSGQSGFDILKRPCSIPREPSLNSPKFSRSLSIITPLGKPNESADGRWSSIISNINSSEWLQRVQGFKGLAQEAEEDRLTVDKLQRASSLAAKYMGDTHFRVRVSASAAFDNLLSKYPAVCSKQLITVFNSHFSNLASNQELLKSVAQKQLSNIYEVYKGEVVIGPLLRALESQGNGKPRQAAAEYLLYVVQSSSKSSPGSESYPNNGHEGDGGIFASSSTSAILRHVINRVYGVYVKDISACSNHRSGRTDGTHSPTRKGTEEMEMQPQSARALISILVFLYNENKEAFLRIIISLPPDESRGVIKALESQIHTIVDDFHRMKLLISKGYTGRSNSPLSSGSFVNDAKAGAKEDHICRTDNTVCSPLLNRVPALVLSPFDANDLNIEYKSHRNPGNGPIGILCHSPGKGLSERVSVLNPSTRNTISLDKNTNRTKSFVDGSVGVLHSPLSQRTKSQQRVVAMSSPSTLKPDVSKHVCDPIENKTVTSPQHVTTVSNKPNQTTRKVNNSRLIINNSDGVRISSSGSVPVRLGSANSLINGHSLLDAFTSANTAEERYRAIIAAEKALEDEPKMWSSNFDRLLSIAIAFTGNADHTLRILSFRWLKKIFITAHYLKPLCSSKLEHAFRVIALGLNDVYPEVRRESLLFVNSLCGEVQKERDLEPPYATETLFDGIVIVLIECCKGERVLNRDNLAISRTMIESIMNPPQLQTQGGQTLLKETGLLCSQLCEPLVTSNRRDSIIDLLMPVYEVGIVSPFSDVRKITVVCLVAWYKLMGADMLPRLSNLTSSQLKLVSIYYDKDRESEGSSYLNLVKKMQDNGITVRKSFEQRGK